MLGSSWLSFSTPAAAVCVTNSRLTGDAFLPAHRLQAERLVADVEVVRHRVASVRVHDCDRDALARPAGFVQRAASAPRVAARPARSSCWAICASSDRGAESQQAKGG